MSARKVGEQLGSDCAPRAFRGNTAETVLALLFSCGVASFVGLGCGDEAGEEPASDQNKSADPDGRLQLEGIGDGGEAGTTAGLREDGSCGGLTVGDGCAGAIYEGEAVPLDLYLMFDQSGSMSTVVDESAGTNRLDIVRTAVETFLGDEESVGLGAGIGYFGHQPLGETTCDVAEFASSDVEIGPLPGQSAALLASLASRVPTGETPTGAAIRGACEYVASYSQKSPGRNPSILLVTDGEPKAPLSEEICAPTLDDAVTAAAECFQLEGIRTYVLGVGPALTNLNVIAAAGGTEGAFLADLDNKEQVLAAFRAVRFAAQLPCDLPLGDAVSATSVNFSDSTVAYLDFECAYQSVPQVLEDGDCGDRPGWYFDDPAAPTTIHLCKTTCADVKSTGRQLFYSLGCPLQVVR